MEQPRRPSWADPLAEVDPTEPLDRPVATQPGPAAGDPTEPLVAPPPPFGPPPRSVTPPSPPARPSRLRGGTVAALVASWLVAGVVGGVVGARVADDGGGTTAVATGGTATTVAPEPGATIPSGDLGALIARVAPSVVSVQALGATGSSAGQGTGVIVSADGEVLTNAHVVEGARSVRVVLADESSARDADIVGTDAREDLALLRIRDASGLQAATLGDSSTVKVGDDVIAIGNALGLRGSPSVTRGIVSALDRSSAGLTGLIQTDAAINPGNSGGPLFDNQGRVIGINTAIRGGAQNIGFAISINRAKTVLERLRTGQAAGQIAYLGVSTRNPVDGSPGAEITEVSSGTPAASIGLQVGDRITSFDGRPVAGSAELAGLVRTKNPGDRVELRYQRGGQERTATVALAVRPNA
jgi:putative serine protease PepD